MPAIASATPYPWPYHGTLDPTRAALVACLDSRWRAAGPASDRSDDRLARIAAAMAARGALIVAVTVTTRPGPGVGATTVPGWLHPDVVLEAGATSAFYASGLDDLLRARSRPDLVVAGWGLEGPVHSTLRSANDRGYECLLVADASCPIDPDLAFAACEMVRFSGGIFGAFADTDDVVAGFDGGAYQEEQA